MDQMYLVDYSTQSVLNVGIKFDTWNHIENCTILEENSFEIKSYKYRN